MGTALVLGLATALTCPPGRAADTGSDGPVTKLDPMVVNSSLDTSREEIAPSLGAVTYQIGSEQIDTTPQGENAPFQQVVLRAPGVVGDEFGEVHVRGDHGDLQYRVNGVLLPESLNGFAQEVDTHLIHSVNLLTGSLPAQFGFRTAGIFDITTKSSSQLSGGEVSLYGGAYDTIEPSIELGGTKGKWDVFTSLSYLHDNVGIDNTTASRDPLHDATDQEKAFAYLAYRPTDHSRVTLLLSATYATFELPDTPGVEPTYRLAGMLPSNAYDSTAINDNQTEQNYYAVLSYQLTNGNFSFQLSAFTRDNNIQFEPDPIRDLLFDGTAGQVGNTDAANGAQADASYTLSSAHTLRAGFLATHDQERLNTDIAVFPTDGDGRQASDIPFSVIDHLKNDGWWAGFYLQDEWHLTDALTLNYGARYDQFDVTFDHEDQLSPRVNLVWQLDSTTTLHAGYSRYFMPPTLQYVPPATVKEYEGTTNASFNELDSPQKCERSNYFDIGISRQISPAFQVTADSFCKQAKNLLDDGQFGRAVIIDNFNYSDGHIYGAELGSNYKQGPFSAYANFSFVYTAAKDVDSAQFQFADDELAYIATHDIRLDHEGEYTVSAGVSYRWRKNTLGFVDFLYGNGLRAGFANLDKLAPYYPVSVGLEHTFPMRWAGFKDLKLRVECINVADESYELRNGTGLGIAAAAYGPRRSLYAGLSADF